MQVGELKYLPLYPTGHPEFERTLSGWGRYVRYVLELVRESVGDEFDVEIWNELTFGSDFLDINHYFDPPLFSGRRADFMHENGTAWELARRSIAEIERSAPRARTIWGFSNTTWFHTSIADLPPGTSGQSYHPYGTGKRCFEELAQGREKFNYDGVIPSGCAVMPEGWAHTFQQTETLIRLLNPAARVVRPRNVATFRHYITEHGFLPKDLDIKDREQVARAKAKFLLRAPLFWLSKGLSGIHVYNAYYPEESLFGMLDQNGDVTPALRALRRLVSRFSGAMPLETPRPIGVSLERIGGRVGVFADDPEGRYLSQEDVVAVLPYQVHEHKFVIGLYVMTQDFPNDLPPQEYRIGFSGVGKNGVEIEFHDPLADVPLSARRLDGPTDALSLQVALTDVPRLLEVTEVV